MDIVKPVITVGVGRSGSTAFHRGLCTHPRIAYLIGRCGLHPSKPWIGGLAMRAIDWPVIGPRLHRRMRAWEAYDFWEFYCPGFSRPSRDLAAADVPPGSAPRLRAAFARMLTRRRDRLALKVTGWPRTGLLCEIFPDARFVHILRDGRAVANSLIRMSWWDGAQGPHHWRWGPPTAEQVDAWERHGRSSAVVAALQWVLLIEAMETAKAHVPKTQFMEIRYEDLCSDPISTYRRVADFCELDWCPAFEAGIRQAPFRSENVKWQKELDGRDQHALNQMLGDHLRRYGYA